MNRYEFRSFGQDFEKQGKRMARLSAPVPEELWERTSDELYVVCRSSDTMNIKIRAQKLDIKSLVKTEQGLEQWQPVLQCKFPAVSKQVYQQLFEPLNIQFPHKGKKEVTYEELMSLFATNPVFQFARLRKQRFAYLVDNVICETGIILINGARVNTISAESESLPQLQRVIEMIGLNGIENINYVQAIKRVTGIINKPLAN